MTNFVKNEMLELKFWNEYTFWEVLLFSLYSFLSKGAEAESLYIELVKCEDEGVTGF